MKDRLRSKAAPWLRSWGTTFRELKHFVERHYKFVLAALAITYSLIWGGMYLQYQIVKAKDGSDYLRYKTIVVKDVVQNHDAEALFVRDSKGDYDGYGKIEFSVQDNSTSKYSPPPVDYPKHITKGCEEVIELIPTKNLLPGKYTFILHRKFMVDTWIGWKVEKEVAAISDEFNVKTEFVTENDYLTEMRRLYEEFAKRADEFNNRFPQAEIRYIPQIQQQVIVVPTPNTDQAKQQTTSGNGNGKANAPGQLKKGK